MKKWQLFADVFANVGGEMYSRQEFGVMRRRMKDGKSVYYYWVYDENGIRRYRSTGERTKAKALEYVMRRRDEGLLGERDARTMTLNEFCADMFVDGRCPIAKEAAARGKGFSGNTRRNRRISLKKHILPYLGRATVSTISVAQINEWLVSLPEKDKISRSTANQCMDTLTKVLDHAVRLRIIQKNPCRDVESLGDDSERYPAFTREEVRALIGRPEDWKNMLYRLMYITASVTGMRLGEVLALMPQNVLRDRIEVVWSWSPTDKLKPTKTNKPRTVPIPEPLYRMLAREFPSNREGFIFSRDGVKPYTESAVAVALKKRCGKLGIKGKTFHSFRAFVDTQMMSDNVNSEVVRAMIGHSSPEMTEHYMHLDSGEFSHVRNVQNAISEDILP